MIPKLINITEGCNSEVIPLGKVMLLIGREDANINIQDDTISANHASITCIDGNYVLKDNGSTNGSFLNNKKIKSQTLGHNDVIRFGTYSFQVDLKGENPKSLTTGTSVSYPIITIPPSHKNDRYKLFYDIDDHQSQPHPVVRIMSTGKVSDLEAT